MEDDAESAFGIGPGNSTLAVADHVAGAAFEAIFIIEQDAPITGGNKEVGGTGDYALAGGTAATRISVDGDVSALMNPKLGGADSFLEGNSSPR